MGSAPEDEDGVVDADESAEESDVCLGTAPSDVLLCGTVSSVLAALRGLGVLPTDDEVDRGGLEGEVSLEDARLEPRSLLERGEGDLETLPPSKLLALLLPLLLLPWLLEKDTLAAMTEAMRPKEEKAKGSGFSLPVDRAESAEGAVVAAVASVGAAVASGRGSVATGWMSSAGTFDSAILSVRLSQLQR